jgi:hypothetical protein
MKKIELTETQKITLDELQELVIQGEKQLKQFSEESAAIAAKWQQRLETKRAAKRNK